MNLKHNKKIVKSSPLHRFDVLIDKKGIFRIGGRLKESNRKKKKQDQQTILSEASHCSFLQAKIIPRYKERLISYLILLQESEIP